MKTINMFDTIALTKDIPKKKLRKGQVGTVVEKFNSDIYEVEFCDNMGKTLKLTSIHKNFMLVLLYNLETA